MVSTRPGAHRVNRLPRRPRCVLTSAEVSTRLALEAVKDPIDARRARHVLSENQRVLDCVAAMASSDFATVGALWTASAHLDAR